MSASPLPHPVAGTAEPMPSRMAAIARGPGEVDAVYHIGRLRPYGELASTLTTW
ncbi:NgoMIV family type II restriction endonuclease [Streptomyces iakyrus]|uniref:NgoMIV family type II restriction endonuclease n=1 Tax=Streptomyces iakyrus TaxID=68219 RepID=UPI0036E82A2E